ncbi:MAG: hypothetical protein P8I99_03720 [Acidimicrobiales bacterium]|nr:hypothetical protein [Acidimicrobiales bacterium]
MAFRNLFRRSAPTPIDESFGLLIGDLEGPVGRIDDKGTIAVTDSSWRVEWGAKSGADWRLAATQAAVRQDRVDDTPVFETWMRVPGGDVVQRVGVVNDGDGRALVIEYENASPDAVVVATAGIAAAAMTTDHDGASIDGVPWIRSARLGAATVGSDIWAAIAANPTGTDADGAGGAAILTPVPHRQRVTVVVAIEGEIPNREVTPEDIASGWRAVTADALEVEVPDVQLSSAWRRVICDLVLAAGTDDPVVAGEAAWWLDLAGLHREADRGRAAVLRAADRGALDAAGAAVGLRALASRDLRAGETSDLAEVAGPMAAIAGPLLDQTTARLVARATEVHAPEVASDASALAERLTIADREPTSPVAAGAARVLGLLFADADITGRLSMLPKVPESWQGQSIDVRRMVTGLGSLSFSVRWHGNRPAVLWERTGGPDGAVLGCPGLDPSWSTSERNGEALLPAP